MTLAIAEQVCAAVGQWQAVADGGHGVLQDALAANIHMHITSSYSLYLQLRGQVQQGRKTCRIVLFAMQLHGQEGALGEYRAQPGALLHRPLAARQPQCEYTRWRVEKLRLDIRARQPVASLRG